MQAVCFNPRPPRGGRRNVCCEQSAITAFQSTPPAWGATRVDVVGCDQDERFNPRPPRGGRLSFRWHAIQLPSFNPRPPRGGRRRDFSPAPIVSEFQSTPPAWGATDCEGWGLPNKSFQSTPPAWGATFRLRPGKEEGQRFQSTPPAWGATLVRPPLAPPLKVSIHAPRVGGDALKACNPVPKALFQSTPPAWGATRVL